MPARRSSSSSMPATSYKRLPRLPPGSRSDTERTSPAATNRPKVVRWIEYWRLTPFASSQSVSRFPVSSWCLRVRMHGSCPDRRRIDCQADQFFWQLDGARQRRRGCLGVAWIPGNLKMSRARLPASVPRPAQSRCSASPAFENQRPFRIS